ncbi:radical SAM protein [bacterium]|nr:radical SAM protein [bacterium]
MDCSNPSILENCQLCPRTCGVNRQAGERGYCACDSGLSVHSVVLHKGEEPAVSGTHGISNVFFSHCNLQCRFCQNYQISDNARPITSGLELSQVIEMIQDQLARGAENVGFVSPSHLIPQMCMMMDALKAKGCNPVYVMNSNAYDCVDVLRTLEARIQVYLPDFKYMDSKLAKVLSGAEDYPGIAGKALQEMFRQKGECLECNTRGIATNGMIIRHLVLPGYIENTLECLRFIAQELSPEIHISLMSQYHPTPRVKTMTPLNRVLQPREYEQVLNEMAKLGLEHGWIQELDSAHVFLPDFESEDPFAT